MRAAIPFSDSVEPDERFAAYGSNSAPPLGPLQSPLVPRSLRHQLPDWLGGHDQDLQALKGMLKALKVAAESHLEAPVCTAQTVLPFYFKDPYYQTLIKASASVSLSLPYPRLSPAGVWASEAYGLAGNCDYDGNGTAEKLIVAIEYSRAALTGLLILEECGIFESWRILHNTSLGLDGIQDRSEASWSDLEHALRKLTQLPIKDADGVELKHISNIVLIGESAGDSRMQNALRNVLGEPYNSLATVDGAIQPLFAAARCVAWYTWTRLNPSLDHYGCPFSKHN